MFGKCDICDICAVPVFNCDGVEDDNDGDVEDDNDDDDDDGDVFLLTMMTMKREDQRAGLIWDTLTKCFQLVSQSPLH